MGDQERQEETKIQKKVQLTIKDIIYVPRAGFGLLVQFICYFVMSFNTAILNTHLDDVG